MKKSIELFFMCCMFIAMTASCSESSKNEEIEQPGEGEKSISEENLIRSMEILESAVTAHFTGAGMAMARYYNPYSGIRSEETGSVWMYTSSIEAVNAILLGLELQRENGKSDLFDQNFQHYSNLLSELVDNIDYYQGTYQLTSYTQTETWSVYGVHRAGAKGMAAVEGVENVYDDQMWLIRELLEAYKLTGADKYLEKAEYLTSYVLDGWDCTIDEDGNEVGGITWGPGYLSKHSCSNSPIVSPLVWLSEIYAGHPDETTHLFVDPADKVSRISEQINKSDYYLNFAKKIYAWQKERLLRSDGVYDDLMGGCIPGDIEFETINGVNYRSGSTCPNRVGPAYSYNSGTMISGAADLYRVTNDNTYLNDAISLSDASFQYFAALNQDVQGYYSYDIGGFRNWFNGVLMRGYVDIAPYYDNAEEYVDSFQKNLDYAYDNFAYEGFLPTNLLVGWNRDNGKNNTEAMFSFTFAAEYAVLAKYELVK